MRILCKGKTCPRLRVLLPVFIIVFAMTVACGRRTDPVYVAPQPESSVTEETAAPVQEDTAADIPPQGDAGTVSMVPDSPAGLRGASSSVSIVITWDEVSNTNITRYRVYRSDGSEFELAGETVTPAYTDRNVEPGRTYTYRVTAVSDSEGMPSPELKITMENKE